jgi:capsular polysaccharide biosynthesis protein
MARLLSLRFLESYFRHRWLYLLPLLLMAGVAIFYFVTVKPTYIVRGVLYVQQQSLLASLTSLRSDGFSVLTPAEATAQELGDLLQTDSFIRALIQQTDLEATLGTGDMTIGETIEEVRKAVWVETQGPNQVRISAAWERPQVAYQLATASLESFIQWRINADRQESEVAQAFFAGLLEQYRGELELARVDLQSYLAAHPEQLRGKRPDVEQLEIDRLKAAVDLAQTRFSSVLAKDEDARLAMAQAESDARQTYLLIDSPAMPTEPETSLRKVALNMLVYLSLGLILTVVAVAGGMMLDRSLTFPVDARNRLELPVLAMVPEAPAERRSRRQARRQAANERQAGERLAHGDEIGRATA